MRVAPANVVTAAKAAQVKYDIFASVTLGQWALESDWGVKCTGRFNFFGVKAGSGPRTLCWTHEERGGHLVPCQQKFRDFADLQQAFEYHAFLLATDHRYASAMRQKDNLDAFVRAMGPIYATDKNYATKLLALIADEEFTRFDK